MLSLLYIKISLETKPGALATIYTFKLNEGSSRKYCSNINSGLKITEKSKGKTSRLNLSNPCSLKKGTNLPYYLLWLEK